jgi:hypothetical protein
VTKGYDSDSYVVCATVIPVLYLAFVVQGGTYDAMLKTALQAARKSRKRQRDYAAANLLPVAGYITLAASAAGEIGSLSALFDESAPKSTRVLVFITMVIVMVAAIAAPIGRWFVVQSQTNELLEDPELNNPVGGQHAKTARKGDV